MVKVCDAIMGSGKTSSVINYINDHPEKRFLYITPYLDEADRIKTACPNAEFVTPSNKRPDCRFSKSIHTTSLVDKGLNIASTHQAVLFYSKDTLRKLREKNYTVIIDEGIDPLERDIKIDPFDMRILEEAGYIEKLNPESFVRTKKRVPYDGGRLSSVLRMMELRPMIEIDKGRSSNPYYWRYPVDFLKAVDDIIVLTYLFDGSEMDLFLRMHDIPYTYIGINRDENGRYTFADHPNYVPDYVKRLPEMIHILDDKKLNAIGSHRHDLSLNWYKSNPEKVEQLRKHLYNYFFNKTDTAVESRLCGTYKDYWGKIRAKGYWNSNLTFNQKATNAYRNCTTLAYPVNLFPNTNLVNYYGEKGFVLNQDRYALSIMIQWIWRSAIRDGKEIILYIPSKRMRTLLIDWLYEVSGGGMKVA